VSLDASNNLSAPVEVYRFEDVQQATIILDEQSGTWFMYYRGENRYGLKLAPAGPLDTTPPTAPANLTTVAVSDSQIDLSWEPALDSETGIAQYKIFRDGDFLEAVKGLAFSDTGLDEAIEYTYAVSAVNYHGVEGPQSTLVAGSTLTSNELSQIIFLPCQMAAIWPVPPGKSN
jgi:hypothetical protein